MPALRELLKSGVVVATCVAVTVSGVSEVGAAPVGDDRTAGPQLAHDLAKAVTAGGVNRHLVALQRIADRNGGNRAAGTPGYQASADYVANTLTDAGFDVTVQELPFTYREILASVVSVAGTRTQLWFPQNSPNTPAGGITAPLAAVPVDETPGCEAADFKDKNYTGTIALVQRGPCTFTQQGRNAQNAGAVGVIIYNKNRTEPIGGQELDGPDAVRIPVANVPDDAGKLLVGHDGEHANLDLRLLLEQRITQNVIAQTRTGRRDNVVLAGAHLDGVPAGPGINDNGSGAATLVETALRLGSTAQVRNAVRFAWWGAEEFGLVGSKYYVDNLSFNQQLDLALYLNVDMIGSPNAAYFVYNGDAGPYGSTQIEKAFADYFTARKIPTERTDSTSSDHRNFRRAGIPVGGVSTGAGDIKTPAQAEKWGGTAGIPYDQCYHRKCDTLGNINRTALDRNADAIAFVTASYAISTDTINGVPARQHRTRTHTTTP